MAEGRVPIMSLYQAFNKDKDRGFVPYRKIQPEYQSLAEQAKEFEERVTIPKKLQQLEEQIKGVELRANMANAITARLRLSRSVGLYGRLNMRLAYPYQPLPGLGAVTMAQFAMPRNRAGTQASKLGTTTQPKESR
jgi:hypothetical protein